MSPTHERTPDRRSVAAEPIYSFGPFRLFPVQRKLLENDSVVRLGGRAFDMLVYLIERAGSVVGKNELTSRVWPHVIVGEGSLRFHLVGLRRALGDGHGDRRYIVNVPGRGYSFVAPVLSSATESIPQKGAAADLARRNPLPPVRRMVGRDGFVQKVVADLPEHRFVTIVGPGGIGKTTVEIAVAASLASAYSDGVQFFDLAPLADGHLLTSMVASSLGITATSGNHLQELIVHLREKRMLMILDSCEHVLEEAAVLAEAIFQRAAGVHVLASSREPLRAQGEQVRHLLPLPTAPVSADITAREALAFSAVELFIERAAANLGAFSLSDGDAPAVAEMCRKLDGIPLAIELVAGRVDTFGIRGLAQLLQDGFELPSGGRRTAVPRHRTMTAALEWSYQWLADGERAMLRRLAVFVGGFGLQAACEVAGGDAAAFEATECLANLVDKSLVTADISEAEVVYRLLDTTRAYALGKLAASDEYDATARRHAEYYLNLFERSESDWGVRPTEEWLNIYGREIDNLRAALSWAFSETGDRPLGISLTLAAAPLWFQLSLIEESRAHFDRALSSLGSNGDLRQRMRLLTLRICVLSNSTIEDIRGRLHTVLELAETLGDLDHRALALWALCSSHSIRGEHELARECVEKFRETAEAIGEPDYLAISEGMFAGRAFHNGDVVQALRFLDKVATRPPAPIQRAKQIRHHMASFVHHRSMRTTALFLVGLSDKALQTESENYDYALRIGLPSAQINLLRQSACLIALYCRDLANAELYVGRLLELSRTHENGISAAMARCFEGMLLNLRGDASEGVPVFRDGIARFRATKFAPFFPLVLSNFAETLAESGNLAEGLAAADEAIEGAKLLQHWYLAEVRRVKGRLSFLNGRISEAEAELREALELAHRQGTLAWELRIACNLAELYRAQGQSSRGKEILLPVYARFSEGFERPALRSAARLVEDLGR